MSNKKADKVLSKQLSAGAKNFTKPTNKQSTVPPAKDEAPHHLSDLTSSLSRTTPSKPQVTPKSRGARDNKKASNPAPSRAEGVIFQSMLVEPTAEVPFMRRSKRLAVRKVKEHLTCRSALGVQSPLAISPLQGAVTKSKKTFSGGSS
jgi:hypothetical protein